jgi:hypothetical protein
MHPPTGFAGMESLDIPGRIRMLRKSFDMFTDYPAIFFGELPDELFYTIFDVDPHITPVLEPKFFFCLIPWNELTVFINLVKVPFQSPLLVLGDEIRNGIAKRFSRRFYIRERFPRTLGESHPLIRDFHHFAFCFCHVLTSFSQTEYLVIRLFSCITCTTLQAYTVIQ